MDSQKDRVIEALTEPEVIQQGDFGELVAIRYYEETPLTSKFLVVVYKEIEETDGFVITAYYASTPSERRKELWKQ